MAQHAVAQTYDFESQLELGEMLLNLGRVEEAAIELKKAKDLNEIGAYTTADGDPQRQADLRRLAQALSRVDDLQGDTTRANRVWSYLAAALLLGITGIVFFVWALNRNELTEIRAQATSEAQLLEAARSQELALLNAQVAESTRLADQIADLYLENSQIQYAGTEIARAYEESAGIAQIEAAALATASALLEQSSTTVANSAASANVGSNAGSGSDTNNNNEGSGAGAVLPTNTPAPTEIPPTRLPDEELGNVIDQLRVDAWAANLRQGPGFNFFVIDSLRRGAIVTVIAKSEDTYWYNVVTEDGINAWLHSSVAKPLSLDWLPPAQTEPAAPFVPPPPQAESTPVPVVPTPLPTPIPPPVEESAPPQEEVAPVEQPAPTEEEAAPPTEGEESAPADGEETAPVEEPAPTEGEEAPPADGGDSGEAPPADEGGTAPPADEGTAPVEEPAPSEGATPPPSEEEAPPADDGDGG